jgi:hypothetical protein
LVITQYDSVETSAMYPISNSVVRFALELHMSWLA